MALPVRSRGRGLRVDSSAADHERPTQSEGEMTITSTQCLSYNDWCYRLRSKGVVLRPKRLALYPGDMTERQKMEADALIDEYSDYYDLSVIYFPGELRGLSLDELTDLAALTR